MKIRGIMTTPPSVVSRDDAITTAAWVMRSDADFQPQRLEALR